MTGRVLCGAARHRSRRTSGVGAHLRGLALHRDTSATAQLAPSFGGHLALSPRCDRMHHRRIEGMTMLRTSHSNRPHQRPHAATCGAALRMAWQVRVSAPVTMWRQRNA